MKMLENKKNNVNFGFVIIAAALFFLGIVLLVMVKYIL